MEIILLFNGLGNQMSQYAFFLAKKKVCPNSTCIFYSSDANHNGYELERVFGIKLPGGFKEQVLIELFYLLRKTTSFSRVMRGLLKILRIIRIVSEDVKSYDFDEKMLKHGSALINYYWGGWHSYKYIEFVENEIKDVFQFNQSLISERNKKLAILMNKTNSISIHVRRGDYLKPGNEVWGSVVGKDFYYQAIAHIQSRIDLDAYEVYFFSDDFEWVRNNFAFTNTVFVDWNTGENSWQDMYLMSNCKININPNSTFSWWASWLNVVQEMIMVPDRFIIHHKSKDFYPEFWTQIE